MPGSLLLALAGILLAPGLARADSRVRLLHAVPSTGEVRLLVGSAEVGRARYAGVTGRRTIASRSARWRLVVAGRSVASGRADFEDDRAYTVVAVPQGRGVGVAVLRDATRRDPGRARVRVVHAAPELGTPDVLADRELLAPRLSFRRTTRYLPVDPGPHSFGFARPGERTVLFSRRLTVLADTATTLVVIGSQGRRVQIVAFPDAIR